MPQALISSWLNKPKQTGVVIPGNDAAVVVANEAQNVSSGTANVIEELDNTSECSEQGKERERGAFQSDIEKQQGRSEGAIENAKAGSENQIITIKLHSLEQEDEQPRNLHPQICLHPLEEQMIPAFKVLNTILPVAYSERFYSETTACPVTAAVTMVAMWSPTLSDIRTTSEHKPSSSNNYSAVSRIDSASILISAIRCRLLQPKPEQPKSSVLPAIASTPTNGGAFHVGNAGKPTLYICTLATKPSYRSYGAATALLESVIHRAVQSFSVCAVEAHVWDGHEDALVWYLRRGFVIVKREEGYYRRLRPDAAVLVRKILERSSVTSEKRM